MRLFLISTLLFFSNTLLQAQKNLYSFFAGVDYDISYAVSDNFNIPFVYNQSQYTNASAAYLGVKKDNIYITLGATFYTRTLEYSCTAFEEFPPNQIQHAPGNLIIYDEPSSNCEYSLYLKKSFTELPLSIGYNFSTNKKIGFFLEARYEPILITKSYSELGDLISNNSYIQTSTNTRFHSWGNISVRGGGLKTINNRFALRLGIFIKSNDFDFDKMLVGGNISLQYVEVVTRIDTEILKLGSHILL